MKHHLVNSSVDDISHQLQHCEIKAQELLNEIVYERNNKNRATVIKMLERKLKQLKNHKNQ